VGNKFTSNPDKRSVDLKRLSAGVLKMFSDMQRERLDLHVMFESSGNEPAARAQVLDAVDDLLREGFLQSAGGDFYVLTEKGKRALAAQDRGKPSAG
jgi:DNA-binding PadR family transcriptional regulator